MKKKIYFQNDVYYQFFCFLFLFSGMALVTFSIINIINAPSTKIAENILWIILGIVVIYIFFRFESFNITIDNEKVMMRCEPFFEYDRSQYKATIHFTDIANISIIETRKNSKGRSYQGGHGINSPSLKYFLVFTRKNGRKVRMNVTYHTREHLLEIISEIIIRINATGNIYEGNDPLWIVNHIKAK